MIWIKYINSYFYPVSRCLNLRAQCHQCPWKWRYVWKQMAGRIINSIRANFRRILLMQSTKSLLLQISFSYRKNSLATLNLKPNVTFGTNIIDIIFLWLFGHLYIDVWKFPWKNMIFVPFLLIFWTIPAPPYYFLAFRVLLDIHGFNLLVSSNFWPTWFCKNFCKKYLLAKWFLQM